MKKVLINFLWVLMGLFLTNPVNAQQLFDPNSKELSLSKKMEPKQVDNNLQSYMKRPAHLYQPGAKPVVSSKKRSSANGSRAYGHIRYSAAEDIGYVQFDVENIMGKTLIKQDMPDLYGGAYYDGKLYAYETITDGNLAYDVNFYIFDAATGNIIYQVERIELYGIVINDLAYDYFSNTMYALTGNALYKVNLETGELTAPVAVTGIPAGSNLLTLAIDLTGNVYSINSGSANLYKIDKTTGSAAVRGATGKTIRFAQSMGFDYSNGTLYWCESEAEADNFLKVNTATGEVTTLQENAYEITCFHIPYTYGKPEQPLAVSDLTITPGASGALNAVLNWTNPSLTFEGKPLTNLTAIKIYENNGTTPIHTVSNPTSGATGSYTVTVVSPGNYSYKVVIENPVGGTPAIVTGWIGHDVPAIPGNVKVVKNDMTANLSWTASAAGLHGGHFTTTGLVYDVYRLPGNTKVSSNQAGSTFSETIMQPGDYSYRVVAKNAGGEGGSATSNILSFCPIISTFPWNFGFEGNGTNFPSCWEQEYVVSTVKDINWRIVPASVGTPPTIHGGSYKAYIGDYYRGSKTMLITPRIDLTQVANPRLNFWHTQAVWGPDQDILRVYYKTSESGEWVLLQEYTDNVSAWTERIIVLPNASTDYYIGFEGQIQYAHGIQLDDITIEETPTVPIIDGTGTLAFGTVYNNLPWVATKEYVIQNKGGTPLTVTGIVSATPGITVTGLQLPATINPLETKIITVTLDVQGHSANFYNGSFVLASNDQETPEFTVAVTGTVRSKIVSDYIEENFNNEFNDGVASGWALSARVVNWPLLGFDNSPSIRMYLFGVEGGYNDGYVQTCHVNMRNNPKITFNYKALYNEPGSSPAAADAVSCSVLISKDNGKTWDEIPVVTAGNHIPSADYIFKEVDASAYANELCLVRFFFKSHFPANIFAFIDNVTVGTEFTNELAAVSISGSTAPTTGMAEKYTVRVKSNGSADQTDYTVKLMQKGIDGDTEIASLPGITIKKHEIKEFVFNWIPAIEGIASIYGEVVLAEDELPNNNKTNILSINVLPVGTIGKIVGTGTGQMKVPFYTYYRQSLAQTLYYPNELGTNSGEITSLIYKANYVYDGPNLANVPVRVWIGETDKEDLSDGWVYPATLTEVFEGTLSFPAGQYDVVVPFNAPYQYKGGTLVVYTYRIYGDYGDINDGYFGTETPGITRTISYNTGPNQVDPANPANPTGAWYGFPNTIFVMNVAGMGSLSGVINDGTNPMDSVKIQITGAPLYVLTAADGTYKFPYLKPGEYEIEISKHGYITQTYAVTIPTDGAVTQNATLALIPVYTVSGKVIGSDTPGGLENVQITLSGYDNYATTTDASGNYSIPDVYGYEDFTYAIHAKLPGYNAYNATVEITDASVIHNITLNKYAYVVLNPTAVIENDNAVITWEAPKVTTFRYDNGVNQGQTGFSTGMSYSIMGSAHRVGAILHKVSWYTTNESPQHNVKLSIFGLKSDGTPDRNNLIYTVANIPNTPMQWCEYEFPEPLEAPNGFFIGLSPTYSGYLSLGLDIPDMEYPFQPNTHYYTFNYNNIEFTAFENNNIKKNAMIRAEGISMGKMTAFGYSKTIANVTSEQTLVGEQPVFIPAAAPVVTEPLSAAEAITTPIGYTVYRLLKGAIEEEWNVINELGNDVTTHTDIDWSTLTPGAYQYAIKAEYVGDNFSKAALTNMLPKDMEVTVTVNVTANIDYPVNGAVVTLTNQDGDLEHVYTETMNSGTIIIPKVWKGTYTISIMLAGFTPYSHTDFEVNTDVSHDAELIEFIEAPYGLKVAPTTVPMNRIFSWNNAPESRKVAYWQDPGTAGINSVYQNLNFGYGVIYDLADYPDAVLDELDFHHASWEGDYGIWNYKVHVIDVDAGESVWISDFNETTEDGAYQWEQGVGLNNITGLGGKKVGIFVEPYSGHERNAWPSISGDRITENTHSYAYNIASGEVYLIKVLGEPLGEFIMNLWVFASTAEGSNTKVKIANSAKPPVNYVVYLNDEQVFTTQDTQYEFTDLTNGSYTAGVKAVYSSGESEIKTIPFTVTLSQLTNITVNGNNIAVADNMSYMAACGEENIVLNLTAEGTIKVNGDNYTDGMSVAFTNDKAVISIVVSGVTDKAYTLTVSKALGSAATPMYVQRWGKTLAVVNNPANNGGHAFDEYKWYHNGILQANDNGYILLNNRPATEYAAEALSAKTGVWHKFCPNVKSQVQSEIVAYPNPVGAGQLLNLNLPEGTDKINIRIYDMSGNLIRQQNGVHSAVTMPNQAGIYILDILLPDGNKTTQKIIVE